MHLLHLAYSDSNIKKRLHLIATFRDKKKKTISLGITFSFCLFLSLNSNCYSSVEALPDFVSYKQPFSRHFPPFCFVLFSFFGPRVKTRQFSIPNDTEQIPQSQHSSYFLCLLMEDLENRVGLENQGNCRLRGACVNFRKEKVNISSIWPLVFLAGIID